MKSIKKPKFEDFIGLIDAEINKRRSKWTLDAISWMDFDDVAQVLRIHIFKKWRLYNPKFPLEPWLNRIITNQISNLRRNIYDNNSRPCLRCAAAEDDELCEIYTKQCSTCPLFAHWEKTKKSAHDIRLPLSIENHANEISEIPNVSYNMEKEINQVHIKMKQILSSYEYKLYNLLFIENLSDTEIAKKCGFSTSEPSRRAGYGTICKIKKSIIKKYKELVQNGEIDIGYN